MSVRPLSPENRNVSGRRGNGTFAPGCSGNAGGRPKSAETVRDLARSHTELAVSALVAIAEGGQSESAKVAAATAILDRGWGRPTQPVSGDDEMPPIGVSVAEREAEVARRQAEARAMIDEAFGRTAA